MTEGTNGQVHSQSQTSNSIDEKKWNVQGSKPQNTEETDEKKWNVQGSKPQNTEETICWMSTISPQV